MFEEREFRATGQTPERLRELFNPFLIVLDEVDSIDEETWPGQRAARAHDLGIRLSQQAIDINTAIFSRSTAGESTDDAHKAKHRLMLNLLFALARRKTPKFSMPQIDVVLFMQSEDDGIGFHPTSNNLVEINLPRPDNETRAVTLATTLLHLTEEVERTTGLSLEESQLIVSRLVRRVRPDIVEETAEQFAERRAIEIMILNARMKRIHHETEAARRKTYGSIRRELVRDMYRRWIIGRAVGEEALVRVEEVDIPDATERFLKFYVVSSDGGQIDFIVPKRLCAGLTQN